MTLEPMPTAAPVPSAVGRRRSGLLAAGVVVLVGLLLAAAALLSAGDQRRADNVASFARAPVGCDTTLDFERAGTFVLFVETTGRIDGLAGGCDASLVYSGVADERLADDLRPGLALTGLDGAVVGIDDAADGGYDVDGFAGTAAWSVEISAPGDHVLTVAPIGGPPLAIAVGRSVDEGVAALRIGALGAAFAALVFGGGLLIAGSRRVPVAQPIATPWVPDGDPWPQSPPGFPAPPPTTGAVSAPRTPPLRRPDDRPPPPTDAPPTAAPSPWGPPGSTADGG